MLIILNSDVIHQGANRSGLSARLRNFATECSNEGHDLVIPETALLEFQHKERIRTDEERQSLASAYAQLKGLGINHDEPDPVSVHPEQDLIQLLGAAGVSVRVEQPLLTDYEDAHRRACFHEAPHGNGKSDEMRDLVIWSVALRLSKATDDNTLLIVGDGLLRRQSGDAEAASVGLERVKTFDDAREVMVGNSPAGAVVRATMQPAWELLIKRGFPDKGEPQLRKVTDVVLVNGPDGRLASAEARLTIATTGGNLVTGMMAMSALDDDQQRVILTDLRDANGQRFEPLIIECGRQEEAAIDLRQNLASLREHIDGGEA